MAQEHNHDHLFTRIGDIQSDIGRLEGSNEAHHEAVIQRLDRINGSIGEHSDDIDDHEKRLTQAESQSNTSHRFTRSIISVMAMGIAIAAVVVAFVK